MNEAVKEKDSWSPQGTPPLDTSIAVSAVAALVALVASGLAPTLILPLTLAFACGITFKALRHQRQRQGSRRKNNFGLLFERARECLRKSPSNFGRSCAPRRRSHGAFTWHVLDRLLEESGSKSTASRNVGRGDECRSSRIGLCERWPRRSPQSTGAAFAQSRLDDSGNGGGVKPPRRPNEWI